MCHEYYDAWWRKAETPARKTEDVKPEVMATPISQPDEKAKPARERAVEKELVPAD